MLDTTEINKERKELNTENMVLIDAGSFMMGSDKFYPEEKPVHKVTVDGFWMDKCPVTNNAFSDFVSATNYMTVAERPLNPADFPLPRRSSSSLNYRRLKMTIRRRYSGRGCDRKMRQIIWFRKN